MKLLDFIINVEKDLNCVLDIPEQFLDSYNSNDWIEIELKIKDTTYTHRIQKKKWNTKLYAKFDIGGDTYVNDKKKG